MKRLLVSVLVMGWLLGSVATASAERNWEFSFGAFGGLAFHGDTTFQNNILINPSIGPEPVNVKGTNLRFEDSEAFGAKISAWYLPKKRSWQPQIGFEIDWTRFTADVPGGQIIPATGGGLISGTPIGSIIFGPLRKEFAIDNMTFNLLFRYPIWATPDIPHGRWYPYVGIGGGAQRARLSIMGYEETSYSPCFQGMGGIKFFVIKYLALFGEAKWTQGWHTFKYETDWYWERYSMSTIQLVGGVALHF